MRNKIYKDEFDKRGFDTMWTFLQMGHQETNIPKLQQAIKDLIKMMTQKSSGKIKKDINIEENFDMTIITIVLESVALYLSGDLEKLEKRIRNKGVIMEAKKMTEADIKKFIEMFNKDFKGKIKNKQTTFLIDLYKNYINLNVSNPTNSEVFKNLEILDNKICEKLNDENQKLFRKWSEIQENYLIDTAEQAFIYGFCVCRQLENETKREGDKNE